MSTCPTNPVVDVPSSRDTSNSCGKIREIKAQPSNNNNMTQNETFAYLMRNPPLNRFATAMVAMLLTLIVKLMTRFLKNQMRVMIPLSYLQLQIRSPPILRLIITEDMNTIADDAMKLVAQEEPPCNR